MFSSQKLNFRRELHYSYFLASIVVDFVHTPQGEIMRFPRLLPFGALSLFMASCSSLSIQNADYGWPVEVVATVSRSNMVSAERYGLTFSMAKIAAHEFQDSTALYGSTVRFIRSNVGYYFVSGPRFKHVYVFSPADRELVGENIIAVSETGLQNPKFNLRDPYVELLDSDGYRKLLTHKAIAEGVTK